MKYKNYTNQEARYTTAFDRLKFAKRLQPDRQFELIKKAQAGDLSARNQLIENNISLVRSTVRHICSESKEIFNDLVQEGILGMIEAVNRFDLSKGTQFSTYALFWITQRIYRYYKQNRSPIRLPEQRHQRVTYYYKLCTQENLSFTTVNIAKVGEISEEQAYQVFCDALCLAIFSLDQPLKDCLDGYSFYEIIAKRGERDQLSTIALRETIDEILNLLSPASRNLIYLLFLNPKGPLSESELAQMWGCTSSYINHIKRGAFKKILSETSPETQQYIRELLP